MRGWALVLLAAACSTAYSEATPPNSQPAPEADGGTAPQADGGMPPPAGDAGAAFDTSAYAQHVDEAFDACQASVMLFRSKVEAFTNAPNRGGLEEIRELWLAAYSAYAKTEAFRLEDSASLRLRANLDTWPVDENILDYVVGSPNSGLVNDQNTAITKEVLRQRHQAGGEANVTIGFHAIEFLLWGQDLLATSPGTRAFTDYTTLENATRRQEVLRASVAILEEDLTALAQTAKQAASQTSLHSLVLGLHELTQKLSQDKLRAPHDSRSQEDEVSDFSDSTNEPLIANIQSITTIYNDVGIAKAVTAISPKLDAKIRADLQAASLAITLIPLPFDGAISDPNERGKILAAAEAVDTLSGSFQTLLASPGLSPGP